MIMGAQNWPNGIARLFLIWVAVVSVALLWSLTSALSEQNKVSGITLSPKLQNLFKSSSDVGLWFDKPNKQLVMDVPEPESKKILMIVPYNGELLVERE